MVVTEALSGTVAYLVHVPGACMRDLRVVMQPVLYPGSSVPEHSPRTTGLGCRLHSAPNLSDFHVVRPKLPKPPTDPLGATFSPPQTSAPQPCPGLQSCRPLRGSPKLPDFLQRSPLPPILGSPTKVIASRRDRALVGSVGWERTYLVILSFGCPLGFILQLLP